ncbi:uncharacterized protein LOC134844444 isoform X2 [Symsagittifera roscoffensis]|uniref:uncharacterized protein LOC134844444 isoform X2 n=1 Tax=Symsagittifera roscoffensis TaxID=84072 RepID=UPI00307BC126
MTSETKSDKVAKREIMVTLLFFGALVAAIVASAIIGFHKFFTTEESVSEKVSLVVQHNNPAFVFFGDDFYVELCRVILLQPGSLDLTSMFRNSSPCVGRQVNIPLDSGDLKYLSENKLSGDSDFDSFLNLFIQKNFNQTGFEKMDLSLMLIEGPSFWEVKETVYAKIRSPKSEFLHPLYILMDYQATNTQFQEMESLIRSSDNLKALYSFNDFISKERTSFRLVSSETATMLTMNDATIIHEKHHVTMRKIQAEPTYMCSFANAGGMIDCNSVKTDNADSIHIKPNCTTAEERSRTTYSESMFRWADGHLSEKISLKKRDIWSIFGAIVTMILALDKLNATVQKYKSTSAVKEIREKTKEKIKREKTLYDIKEGKNNVENANETSSEQNV